MNEAHFKKPITTIKMYAILFVFLVIGVVMLFWPILSMRDMLGEINSQAKYITLDKGAYYLFGGGLFFLTIAIGTVLSFFFKDSVATRFVKYFGISLAVSLVLVFVLPQAVHYCVEDFVFDKNYVVCEAKSTQWLHAKTIVYAKTLPCD